MKNFSEILNTVHQIQADPVGYNRKRRKEIEERNLVEESWRMVSDSMRQAMKRIDEDLKKL